MGSGDDHVIFSSTTSELDTIVGGTGTDTIELSSDEDYSTSDATAADDLSGISGFEVLRLQTGVDIDGRNFTNNSGLTKLVVEATGAELVTPSEELCESTRALFQRMLQKPGFGNLLDAWESSLRLVARDDDSFMH